MNMPINLMEEGRQEGLQTFSITIIATTATMSRESLQMRNFETNMFRFGTPSFVVVCSLVTWGVFVDQ